MSVNDLTGQNIQDTYQRVVQTNGTKLADGTGSLLPIEFNGNHVIISGTLTAQSYIVSESVTSVSSGSTIFGNTSDDVHQFTGSLKVTGSDMVFITNGDEDEEGFIIAPGFQNTNEQYILLGGDVRINQFDSQTALGISTAGSNRGSLYVQSTISGSSIKARDYFFPEMTKTAIQYESNTFQFSGTHSSYGSNAYIFYTDTSGAGIKFHPSGHVSASGHVSGSVISASIGFHTFGDVTANGNISGGSDTSTFTAATGSYHVLQGDTSQPTSLVIDGQITASDNISSSGIIFASSYFMNGVQTLNTDDGDLSVGGGFAHIEIDGALTSSGDVRFPNLLVTGSISGSQISSSGNISTAGNISASGHISASVISASIGFHTFGDITGNSIIGTQNLSVTGQISGSQISSSGNLTVGLLGNTATGNISASAHISGAVISASTGFHTFGDVTANNVYNTQNYVNGIRLRKNDNVLEVASGLNATSITASAEISAIGKISSSDSIESLNYYIGPEGSQDAWGIHNPSQQILQFSTADDSGNYIFEINSGGGGTATTTVEEGNFVVSNGNASIKKQISGSQISASGNLTVGLLGNTATGNISASGHISGSVISASIGFHTFGDITASNNGVFGNSIVTPTAIVNTLRATGSSTDQIVFSDTDEIQIKTSAQKMLRINESQYYFNYNQQDMDFIVRGDGVANLIDSDGGLGKVGINHSPLAASATFHVGGDISGSQISSSGNLTVGLLGNTTTGNISASAHISGAVISASTGFHTFGDITAGTGSFHHITASGNISTSADIRSDRIFVDHIFDSTGAGTELALTSTTCTWNGIMDLPASNEATDASGDTGVLRVEGGASIAKSIYVGSVISGSQISSSGNISATGNISASGHISGGMISASIGFWGDGSNLTNLPASGIDVSGTPANNQIAVWTDADTLEGDSLLTFDGATLSTGTGSFHHITASGNISASGFIQTPEIRGNTTGDQSGSLFLSGSLTLKDNIGVPAVSQSTLYNNNGHLYYGGGLLGGYHLSASADNVGYIKILHTDWIPDDGNTYFNMSVEGDGSVFYLKANSTALDLYCFKDIPWGWRATAIQIYGQDSDGDSTITVHNYNITDGTRATISTTPATYRLNTTGEAVFDTPMVSTATNALMIDVDPADSTDGIFGGYVRIERTHHLE
jgi:hypothetical protein